MKTDSATSDDSRDAVIVRVAGLLGFLMVGIALVVNLVLFDSPTEGAAALAEPKTYISDQAGRMAIANGLRNLVFFCIPFWAAGLYTFTRCSPTLASNPWGIVGLLGAVAVATVGTITNGVQTATFLNYGGISEQRDTFLLLWSVTDVLFAAAQVFTAVWAAGFSLAGWRSGAMPRWLVGLGLITAAATLLTCVGIVSVMTGGWAQKVQLVSLPLTLVWILSASVLMVRRPSA